MPKQWLKGVVAFIPKKSDHSTLKNFRPITLINIICKIWAIIMTIRLTPYMNVLTRGTQTAYKQGRSTIDIPPVVQNILKQKGTKLLILIDLSKAFDSVHREILWAILYEKGVPWEMIKRIKMGHKENRLCPKYKGNKVTYIYNNKGVSQGIPISAMLL